MGWFPCIILTNTENKIKVKRNKFMRKFSSILQIIYLCEAIGYGIWNSKVKISYHDNEPTITFFWNFFAFNNIFSNISLGAFGYLSSNRLLRLIKYILKKSCFNTLLLNSSKSFTFFSILYYSFLPLEVYSILYNFLTSGKEYGEEMVQLNETYYHQLFCYYTVTACYVYLILFNFLSNLTFSLISSTYDNISLMNTGLNSKQLIDSKTSLILLKLQLFQKDFLDYMMWPICVIIYNTIYGLISQLFFLTYLKEKFVLLILTSGSYVLRYLTTLCFIVFHPTLVYRKVSH